MDGDSVKDSIKVTYIVGPGFEVPKKEFED
jgi:hypothetical protein